MFALVTRFNADSDPIKVNLAPGTYKDPEGKPWVLPALQKAAEILLDTPTYNHEYLGIQGHLEFLRLAAQLTLGSSVSAVASLQTVGGTGACHIGAVFLKKLYDHTNKPLQVFISDPSWENHHAVFQHVGLQTRTYSMYDTQTKELDFVAMKATISAALEGSVIVLHACAHNPTGCDPSPEQWDELALLFKERELIAFFDSAYQGSIETFLRGDVQLLVAQSFSKNAGMYGERLGALHVPCPTSRAADHVVDILKAITRREISTPPRFAADLMTIVMSNPELFQEWTEDIRTMSNRLSDMRKELVETLRRLGTPGDWTHITKQRGMFSFTGLTAAQTRYLTDRCHIYLPPSGRLSVTGLTRLNMGYVTKSIDFAVRNIRE
ncbi:uncharacterized protein IL334_005142 [Kwoniella shivajii]|uniref:Aspartate aminotransferase n=1 Tax=Kwoniella shivajii TaxID=564305 RepID=A0ABZ1D2C2_9TREE|nr:hypothetical protein IL334_005142 [Kwoniella shivajii]